MPEPAPPGPARKPAPPPQVEHTRWSLALVGFYLSCAGVSLGAGIGAAGYAFFDSVGTLVFGCVMSGISCVTTYLTLRAARRPPERR
jgi:hypothetical protein